MLYWKILCGWNALKEQILRRRYVEEECIDLIWLMLLYMIRQMHWLIFIQAVNSLFPSYNSYDVIYKTAIDCYKNSCLYTGLIKPFHITNYAPNFHGMHF